MLQHTTTKHIRQNDSSCSSVASARTVLKPRHELCGDIVSLKACSDAATYHRAVSCT